MNDDGGTNYFISQSIQTLLGDVKTSIDALADKQPSPQVRSKLLSLNSANRNIGTDENAPTYTLPTTFTCTMDEYIKLTLIRMSFYHDMMDIPDSTISFTKSGVTQTVTIPAGKHLLGSLATLIQNAYIVYDTAFKVSYNSGRGAYIFSFSSATTMKVVTPDLQRVLGLPSGNITTTLGNVITSTLPVRAQKWLYVNVIVPSVTPQSPSFAYNATSSTMMPTPLLASIPILSSPYVLANWRQYSQNEQALRITDTSISSISLQFLDTVTGLPVPLRENDACIQIAAYKK